MRPGVLWYVSAYAFVIAGALPYVELMGGWGSPWAWLAFVTPFPMIAEPFTYKAVQAEESEK